MTEEEQKELDRKIAEELRGVDLCQFQERREFVRAIDGSWRELTPEEVRQRDDV